MSQNHINYMSGVPVKIAENYKPPKKLAIHQNVAQRLANSSSITQQILANSAYDFDLERTVSTKMSEWQHVRQREICDRKERMRCEQHKRQKQLEVQQKQMLTAVSYPSTDDLSSDDGDDSGHGTSSDASKPAFSSKTMATHVAAASIPISRTITSTTVSQHFSLPNHFDSILVPTIMPDRFYRQSGGVVAATKMPNYTKINYSDFENDTSSPFDNVELKTINDLDILAQVLNTSATVCSIDRGTPNQLPDTDEPLDNIKEYSSAQQTPQQQQQQQQRTQQQIYIQNRNSLYQEPIAKLQPQPQLYHSATMISNSAIPITNSYYVHQLTYDHQIDKKNYNCNGINALTTTTPIASEQQSGHYYSEIRNDNRYADVHNHYHIPNNNYFSSNYTNISDQLMASAPINDIKAGAAIASPIVIATTSIQSSAKSKSKSVPDILQEINGELKNSEGKRVACNNSINTMEGSEITSSTTRDINSQNRNAFQLPAVPMNQSSMYDKLSMTSQQLAKNISMMGFPLERVARIMQKLGNDDKKIIEHLIPLSELLDLGFDETKTSNALLKFENNKGKALDHLIS